MRVPRVRFTVRRMMVGVVIMALLLWGRNTWRVRSDYLRMAAECTLSEKKHLAEQRMWETQAARLGPEHVVSEHSRKQAALAAEVVSRKAKLRQIYEAAARHPWRSSFAVPSPYTSPYTEQN